MQIIILFLIFIFGSFTSFSQVNGEARSSYRNPIVQEEDFNQRSPTTALKNKSYMALKPFQQINYLKVLIKHRHLVYRFMDQESQKVSNYQPKIYKTWFAWLSQLSLPLAMAKNQCSKKSKYSGSTRYVNAYCVHAGYASSYKCYSGRLYCQSVDKAKNASPDHNRCKSKNALGDPRALSCNPAIYGINFANGMPFCVIQNRSSSARKCALKQSKAVRSEPKYFEQLRAFYVDPKNEKSYQEFSLQMDRLQVVIDDVCKKSSRQKTDCKYMEDQFRKMSFYKFTIEQQLQRKADRKKQLAKKSRLKQEQKQKDLLTEKQFGQGPGTDQNPSLKPTSKEQKALINSTKQLTNLGSANISDKAFTIGNPVDPPNFFVEEASPSTLNNNEQSQTTSNFDQAAKGLGEAMLCEKYPLDRRQRFVKNQKSPKTIDPATFVESAFNDMGKDVLNLVASNSEKSATHALAKALAVESPGQTQKRFDRFKQYFDHKAIAKSFKVNSKLVNTNTNKGASKFLYLKDKKDKLSGKTTDRLAYLVLHDTAKLFAYGMSEGINKVRKSKGSYSSWGASLVGFFNSQFDQKTNITKQYLAEDNFEFIAKKVHRIRPGSKYLSPEQGESFMIVVQPAPIPTCLNEKLMKSTSFAVFVRKDPKRGLVIYDYDFAGIPTLNHLTRAHKRLISGDDDRSAEVHISDYKSNISAFYRHDLARNGLKSSTHSQNHDNQLAKLPSNIEPIQ